MQCLAIHAAEWRHALRARLLTCLAFALEFARQRGGRGGRRGADIVICLADIALDPLPAASPARASQDLGRLMRGMPLELEPFSETLRASSVAFLSTRDDTSVLQNGDKVILPPSALEALTMRHVQYPMSFRLDNPVTGLSIHTGVIEFTAPEGKVYIPSWLMDYLALTEGYMVQVTNVRLPKATFVKLQPHSKTFLDLSNPKAV